MNLISVTSSLLPVTIYNQYNNMAIIILPLSSANRQCPLLKFHIFISPFLAAVNNLWRENKIKNGVKRTNLLPEWSKSIAVIGQLL